MELTTELQTFLSESFLNKCNCEDCETYSSVFFVEKMDSNRYGDITFIVGYSDKFYAIEAYYDEYNGKLDFSTLIREVKPVKKVVYEYTHQVNVDDLDDLDSESYEDSDE